MFFSISPFHGFAVVSEQNPPPQETQSENTGAAVSPSTLPEPSLDPSPEPSGSSEPESSIPPEPSSTIEPAPENTKEPEPSASIIPQATGPSPTLPLMLHTEQNSEPPVEAMALSPTILDISMASIMIDETGATGKDPVGTDIAETVLNPLGYIITGSTTNNQATIAASTSVTLQNTNISPDISKNTYALRIADGASVSIVLDGSNTLKSGDAFAGLDVRAATVTIGGSGSLNASGGEGRYTSNGDMWIQSGSGGAGIGGIGTSTINITGGTIRAYGMRGGAGIGGNGAPANDGGATTGCSAGTVRISGGTVYANGGDGASPGAWGGSSGGAGIGSGYRGAKTGNQISLTGGRITASGGGRSDAIGGGAVSVTNADILAYAGEEASALAGNLSISSSASIEGYSDGTLFPVYDKNEPEGTGVLAPMLNIVLKQRANIESPLNVTLTPAAGGAVSLTLPAKQKGFVKTVGAGTWKISTENVAQAPQADPYSDLFTTDYARVTAVPYIDPLTLKDVVFVRDDGSDANDGATAQTAFQTLEKAYLALKPGGTVVVCGKMNINIFSGSLNKVFTKPSTVTSVYAGTDYRQTNDAQFWGTGSPIMMCADTTFQSIYLNNGNCTYYANGYHLTMGLGVTTNYTTIPGWGDYYPSVYGDCYFNSGEGVNTSGIAVISLASGTFTKAAGGAYTMKGGEQLIITGTATADNIWNFDKITVGSNDTSAYFKITNGGIDPAGVKDIEVVSGSTMEFTAPVLGGADAPVTGDFIGGGTLKLPALSVLVIPGTVSNTTVLDLGGYATLAPGTFVASADKDSAGTFVLPTNTERKLEKTIENDKAVWRIAQADPEPTPTPSPTPSSSPTASPSSSPTPSPTLSPTPTASPIDETVVVIDVPPVPGGRVDIEVPVDQIIEAINDGSGSICTDINVPHDMTAHISSIRIPQEVFAAAKQHHTALCFQVIDEGTGRLLYRWDFMEITGTASDVDIALEIMPIEDAPDINAALAPGSLVISTKHEGKLPGMADLTIYVGDKYKPGDVLDFYYYDNGTLEPIRMGLVVDANGYVKVTLSHCCEYILQQRQAPPPTGTRPPAEARGNRAAQTGDTENLLPLVLLAISSGAILYGSIRKRKKVKNH